ncbi:MAG: 30S ribosomal protein S8e [Candidatus Hydrothermarchaeales archaeon]
MALWQGKSRRKATGGKFRSSRKKRKFEMGRDPIEASVGTHKVKQIRVMGGNQKKRVLVGGIANVLNPKTKKSKKSDILGVVENAANQHYVRRNLITKGAVIDTKLGKAKVTSRPGQDGVINAVLLK